MSVIRILSEAVANKIAAGEVVERPASVVKELLENSLDAGASRIELYVEAGGKRLIRVEDDGCGMSRDDTLLAFERHATSKIRSVEDLFEVATLGFRGEALPSIASVSRLTLETRSASEASGTQLEINGGRLAGVKEIPWPGGSRLQVRDLFYNTPARRKFLKSESTELGHIAGLVTQYALAHPEKAFRLASLTNEILNAPPVTTSRERLYQVMGGQTLEQLVEIKPSDRAMFVPATPDEEERGQEELARPAKIRLFGFASRPEIQKLNRYQIYFFVNRRLVRDRLMLHAIAEAYRNILPAGMYPVALIFLELPPSEVDVNVHPAKTEVRFRHASFAHDFVRDTIRSALLASRPIAAFPLRSSAGRERREEIEDMAAAEFGEAAPTPHPDWGSPSSSAGVAKASPETPSGPLAEFRLSSPSPPPETGVLPLSAETVNAPLPAGIAGPNVEPFARASEDAMTAESASEPAHGPVDEFPKALRPLGQIHESFIVATNDDGLWIIDQHVAHERVLFERHLQQRREQQVEGQRLLLPLVVELRPEQQAAFQEIARELAANGFDAEPFGQRTVAIKGTPAEVRADAAERLLLEILDSAGREARGLSLDTLRHNIAASVACHAAIKVNMPLTRDKMEWLLRELGKTDCPMTCPHGRPVLLRYSLKDIQKAFKRS